jgi:hypothetical protein
LDKRKEYDKLIFGYTDSSRFSNQDIYEYYKNNLKKNTNPEKQKYIEINKFIYINNFKSE